MTKFQNLPCRLTNEERVQRAVLLAEQQLEIDKLREQAQQLNRERRTKEETKQATLTIVSTGVEWRDVEVREETDFEHRKVRIFRTDTNEEVSSRHLSEADAQTTIEDQIVRKTRKRPGANHEAVDA